MRRIAGLFSKGDSQEKASTCLENIPDWQLSEMPMEVAKRLAKEDDCRILLANELFLAGL
jgi:hypothetical protein